jgi:hypothetical protein
VIVPVVLLMETLLPSPERIALLVCIRIFQHLVS